MAIRDEDRDENSSVSRTTCVAGQAAASLLTCRRQGIPEGSICGISARLQKNLYKPFPPGGPQLIDSIESRTDEAAGSLWRAVAIIRLPRLPRTQLF